MTKNNSDNYLTATPKSDIIEKTMSGGDKMADKGVLNTPINKEVLDNFRTKCKEENIPMNVVIELFCKRFAEGGFELNVVNGSIKRKE